MGSKFRKIEKMLAAGSFCSTSHTSHAFAVGFPVEGGKRLWCQSEGDPRRGLFRIIVQHFVCLKSLELGKLYLDFLGFKVEVKTSFSRFVVFKPGRIDRVFDAFWRLFDGKNTCCSPCPGQFSYTCKYTTRVLISHMRKPYFICNAL